MSIDDYKNTKYGQLHYGRRRQFPAVTNYTFSENIDLRSKLDTIFRWEDVYLDSDEDNGLPFIIPNGYVVEVSPDLGLKSPIDHFIPESEDGGNSLLRTSSLLTISNGVLSDASNETVIATLESSDFRALLHEAPFQKYYWRAIAVDEDGGRGAGGNPHYFYYKQIIETDEWTIDDVISPTSSVTQCLRGRKTADISAIEISGSTLGVKFVSSTIWKHDVVLVPGTNKFTIRAKDIRGNWSSYRIVEIELNADVPVFSRVWNTFDEFGLLVGLRRNPQEDNLFYKNRILDVTRNNSGIQYLGALLGAIRAVNAHFVNDAIKIKANDLGTIGYELPVVFVDSHGLIVQSNSFLEKIERHIINPLTMAIFLQKDIFDSGTLSVMFDDDTEIDNSKYSVNFYDNSITFNDSTYANKAVRVSYSYQIVLLWNSNQTLAEVRNTLNAIRYPSGDSMFSVELSTKVSGAESSDGLVLTSYLASNRSIDINISWSDIWIREMNDIEWRDTFRNSRNHFFGTKFDQYVNSIKSLTKTDWGFAVADVSTWDAGLSSSGPQAVLPRQFSKFIGQWIISATNKTVDSSRARFYNYIDPGTKNVIVWSGLPRFHSGIGYDSDLFVRVDEVNRVLSKSFRNIKIVASPKSTTSITRPDVVAEFGNV